MINSNKTHDLLSERKARRSGATSLYAWCRRRRGVFSWTVVAIAVVTAIVLGMIGFEEVDGVKLPLTTRLYLAFQLLTMESGSLTNANSVSWTLEIARWSGVVAAFGTIVNTLSAVFTKRMDAWFIRRLSSHSIVVGAGQSGGELVSGLLAEGQTVVIVDADENNPAIPTLVKRGAFVLHGDAREIEILQAAGVGSASVLIAVTGKDPTNLEIAAAARQARGHNTTSLRTLRCYLHVVDNHLSGMLDANPSATESRTDASAFDRFNNTARLTLSAYPLDRDGFAIHDSRRVHLVIINLNELGEAMLIQSLAIGHFANQRPVKITIIDREATRKRQRLQCRMPELDECGELAFVDGETSNPMVRDMLSAVFADSDQVSTVAICDWDAVTSIRQFVEISGCSPPADARVLIHLGEDERAMDIFNFAKSTPFQLVCFGDAASGCSVGLVLRSELDVLARKIHDYYGAKRVADGDNPDDFPAMRPWDQLSSEYRDMNRQQADHIPIKLRSVGFRMVPIGQGVASAAPDFTDKEIEALAKAEHARWCAGRRLSGWRYGETRDDKRKLHPDLAPWSQLSEKTRDYDRDPVRNLPLLLKAIGYCLAKE